ncbi:flagellar biosynthesis anti-sigma factor FlgM [Alteromonas sp. 5E99-2]|uniref:flagellar biosynthesis anti-sigma factor FlgM n=1 Tax=Alteromonas sp. 5E99-2 TaxID=2817683 RepID=UPI001A98AEB2|nr:flagellar biosynthesis anti-sigma factor FlgM [Alteromonas sp. 5E99-2]MBO1254078.1 flagellar biosynthesis anti-sigma factor FlgM [Alteromonas sp. 5E99-2]
MSINNVNNNGLPNQSAVDNARSNAQQAQNQASAQSAARQTAQAPRQDSVSLTQSAQQLSQVQKKGGDAPVNQEKVDRLKAAVQSGEYQVNPDTLASRIARLESQLFGSE